MAQFVSDCLRIMRLAIGRRNENDPDSNDSTLLSYINDFVTITMTNDVRVFEQYGTLSFTIDETNETGTFTFNDVGADSKFATISMEAFINLSDPPSSSVSWNRLEIYQDPGIFFDEWGVNNSDILVPGYPTEMLYYGTEMVFRTIPDTSYDVTIFGYKVLPEFSSEGDPEIPQDYWMRYIAYGAANNYARDYRFDTSVLNQLNDTYKRERRLVLTQTHNQIKAGRGQPRF